MKTNLRESNDVQIIEISGRIDPTTSPLLEEEFNKIIGSGKYKLAVNLKDVNYISSNGLRVFLSAIKQVKSQNGDVKLYGMTSDVQKIFKISGFTTLFDIQNTEEETLQRFTTT